MLALKKHRGRSVWRSCRVLTLAAVAELWWIGLVFAQAGSGVVAGTVLAPDGARLPGVSITVSTGDSVVGRVVSGEQGGFRLSQLKPGRFEVRADLTGFQSATVWFDIIPDRVTMLDLQLGIEPFKESVVVEARLPRDSLEAPRITESGARDVGEALGAMAGVAKIRRGAIASDIVLRGYQGDNVTVLIDGVRLFGACPNNMDHAAFHVDFAEVDRIEVDKGPFDVRNQGALGGVVNIVTKRPGRGLHATSQLAFGSFGYVNPSATVSYGAGRFAMLGGYSYRVSGSYRDGSGRSFLSAANYRPPAQDRHAFEVNTGWGRADFQPTAGHNVQVSFTRQRAGAMLYPYLQMDAMSDDADRAKVAWDITRALGRVETLRTEAFATRVAHSMTDQYRLSSSASSAGYSMATVARTMSAGGRVEAVLDGGLTTGFEAYHRDWSAEARLAAAGYQPQYSIPDAGLTSLGVFMDYSRTVVDGLRLNAGARLDRADASADTSKANVALYRAYHGVTSTWATNVYPTGKVRLSWPIQPDIVLSGGVGRTVRVADQQERYFGLVRTGTDWVGNPSLRPTSNTGVDVAVSIRRPRVTLNATLHHDTLGDFIIVYEQPRIGDEPGANHLARSYTNVDATMTGGEVQAVLTLTDRLFLAGDVYAVRGRQMREPLAGIDSGNLAEIPPVRSHATLRYDARGERAALFAEAEVFYSARQTRVNTDLGETPTPAFAVMNLRAGGMHRSLRLTVGVGNLFNNTYVEHLSYQRDPFRSGVKVFEPGRTVYGNVGVVF